MKLYRFVKYNYLHTLIQDLKNTGIENEGYNLVFEDYLSPSQRYTYINGSKSKTLPNTFACFKGEDQMTKYFFLSLSDTLNFLNEQRYLDLEKGLKFYYAILEIDLPEDIVKNYLGVGFYGHYLSVNQVECSIPYQLLYESLVSNPDYFTKDCINLYNKSYKKYIYEEEINNLLNLSYLPLNPNLMLKGTNRLYPYLSFKMDSFHSLLNPSDINWITKATNLSLDVKLNQRDDNYNTTINDIIGRLYNNLRFNPDFSKEELWEYATPIIEEENQELKRVLKNNKMHFAERK